MRYFIILLLVPTWAASQIMPEQVIGFASLEDKVFSMVDHAVLVRDEGGWADLYIIHESPGMPTDIIDNIIEIQGQLPTISSFYGVSIVLSVASVEGGNTIEKSWGLAPTWVDGGPNHGPFGPYEVIDMTYTLTPIGEEFYIYDCGMDFQVGGMRIEGKDELIAREEIHVAGPFLHDLERDDTFDLCHY